MADIITNLHPDGDESTNLYPNIKKENIPNKSISTDKLDNNVLSLIGSLKPSGTDTSTNILAFTSNKGIYVATDNGYWYYWNGSAYTDGGVYQSTQIADGDAFKPFNVSIPANADLNDYTIIGSYWVLDGSQTNKPSGYTSNCMLLVFTAKTYGVDALFQILIDSSGLKYIRRKYSTSWTDWRSLELGFYNKGTVNNDFNNYKTDGSYFIRNEYILNKPVTTSWNGLLLVFSGTYSNNTFTYQIAFDQTGKCYIRRYAHNTETWTNWIDYNEDKKSSVLYGKKWYACGDSFTAQGYTSSDPGYGTDSVLPSGKYQGKNAVYPYYIGNRTNCDVQNVAEGGMTLATYTGGTNCFTYNNQYQTLIGEDADIITLYFGINDGHHNVPIGTINDNTTDTFYGALNVVISWILENRPNAKLGVIISNGCDTTDYPIATINACKKWGIPYLDINGDETLPMVIRRNMRTNLSQDAYNYWLQRYRVSATNTHPNYKAHEDESYMIQQFLERL